MHGNKSYMTFRFYRFAAKLSLSHSALSLSLTHSGTCLIRLAAPLERSVFKEISTEQQVNGRIRAVKNQKDRGNTRELFNNIVNQKTRNSH